MTQELQEITVNVDQFLALNKYNIDEDNPHIVLSETDLSKLPSEEFAKLIRVCPAALYKEDAAGNRSFDCAGCLECGTCRILCEGGIVQKWESPAPTMGVQYRYG